MYNELNGLNKKPIRQKDQAEKSKHLKKNHSHHHKKEQQKPIQISQTQIIWSLQICETSNFYFIRQSVFEMILKTGFFR
jgi:hypothetical protein